MIKAFHVLGYLAPRYGGPSKSSVSLGQAMEKYCVSASWWATATREEQQELAHLGEQAHLFPPRFPHFWYRSPPLARALETAIDETDILHLHQVWDYPLYAAARLARQRGKPYVVSPRGIFNHPWRYAGLKKQLYLRLIALPFLNAASVIHAVVPAELSGFRQVGIKAPYVVIPNGINPGEFEKMPHPNYAEDLWPLLKGRKVVLFLGRLSPEKGLDVLVGSWRFVAKEEPSAFLVLAGPDNKGYGATIKMLAGKCDLDKKVLFTGMVQGKEKRALLGRADLLVLPSYSETIGMVVLEALASVKPCVITTGCNFPEVQEVGAGYVVPTGDKAALSNALLKMLALSDAQRQEMGGRGRQLVMKEYTWDTIARKMLTVYRCILESKPVPLYPSPSNLGQNLSLEGGISSELDH